MTAIMNSFNVAYDVEDARNPIVLKLLSILFTIVMAIVLAIALTLPTFGNFIKDHLFGPLGLDQQVAWIFDLVRILLPLIVIIILFLTLYSVAPNVKTKFKSVYPGAIFTSIVWLLGSFAFGWYLSNFGNYSKTYGSLVESSFYYYGFTLHVSLSLLVLKLMQLFIKDMSLKVLHQEAALKHDDNNENHYNENTKYEYDSTASSKYEKL